MLDKFIDGAFKAVTAIVLGGIATAAVMVMVKWMIDLGFLWVCIVIGAAYLFYYLMKKR